MKSGLDVGDVSVNSINGDVKFLGDFVTGQPLGEEPGNFFFTLRELRLQLRLTDDPFMKALASHRASYVLDIETASMADVIREGIILAEVAADEARCDAKPVVRAVEGTALVLLA